MRKLLAVVPARGGSRGIIRKNLRPLGGKPLVLHTLQTLSQVPDIDRIVLSTEDAEIAGIGRLHGFEVLGRPLELAGDAVSLSTVALSIVEELDWHDDLGVFQPTSPLRSVTSIVDGIARFRDSDVDSLASVVREAHLYWHDERGDLADPKPLFSARVNRQYARSSVLRETGSIQLVKADALRNARDLVTPNHLLFETLREESLDIDLLADFESARHRMEQGTVVFRVRANREVGSGHLYHSLSVAEELQAHRVRFLMTRCDDFALDSVVARGWPMRVESNLQDDLASLHDGLPAVLVNDILDTKPEDVLPALALGYRVVNIEDLGPGAKYADWVVNALYPGASNGVPEAVGPNYTTLRTEFMGLPSKTVRRDPELVLVTFGGTDPAGLTGRIGQVLSRLPCEVRVVVGPGVPTADLPNEFKVVQAVENMAEEMARADVVVTSAGRTVYEAAATGTPVVVIAQNAREATHSHISLETGVVFAGIGPLVDEIHVLHVVERLLDDYGLRTELSHRLRETVDGKGARRIASRIQQMLEGLS